MLKSDVSDASERPPQANMMFADLSCKKNQNPEEPPHPKQRGVQGPTGL